MSGGTVYERRDRPGLWVHEVMRAGERTKTYYQSREAADAAKAALLRGADLAAQRRTLGEWLTKWAAEVMPKSVEPKTARTYASIVRSQWLRQPITRLPLNAVEPADVNRALAAMSQTGLSRTTVGHARMVLSAAYTAAREAKLVLVNPVAGTELRGRDLPTRVQMLNLNTQVGNQMIDAAYGTHDHDLVMFLIFTGLRPAEALALRWADVSVSGETVAVRRAVKRSAHGWAIGPPKTTQSTRTIPMARLLNTALMKREKRAGGTRRRPSPEELVFPSPRGGQDTPEALSKRLRPLFDKVGLGEYQVRDTRSLHATLLLAGNQVNITTLAKLLGHAEASTTLRRYAGVVTGADREAVLDFRLTPKQRRMGGKRVPIPTDLVDEGYASDEGEAGADART